MGNQFPSISYVAGNLTVLGNYSQVNWYLNGTYIITGPSIPTALLGQYTAVVKDVSGCKIKTCAFTLSPTSLSEQKSDLAFLMYPNPAKEHLHLSINTSQQASGKEIFNCEIYNPLGELIIKEDVNTSTFDINLSNLPTGLYFLKLKQGSSILIKRFLKGN